MKNAILLTSVYALATMLTPVVKADVFDDRPEFYFRSAPSFIVGSNVGHISSIKKEQDLVFNGGVKYSKEDGRLNDWFDVTYQDRPAWINSRGARAALARLGVGDPVSELKRVTAQKTEGAPVPASAPTSSSFSSQHTSYSSTRSPAAQMPLTAFQNQGPGSVSSNPAYHGLSSSGSPLSSGGVGGPVGGAAQTAPSPEGKDAKNPGIPATENPICAKSETEYNENKILQKAFQGSKNPFSMWSSPEGATLSPNGQGQWDIVVQGILYRTVPIQVCVEKEGKEPYLSVYNKKYAIKTDGSVQSVHLIGDDGKSGTFTQQPGAKSTSKTKMIQ